MIYVMQGRHDPDRVKIGFTTTAEEKRRRGLNTGHGSPLTTLHVMLGGLAEERGLHRRFSESRVPGGGEFFFRTKKIEAWLSTLEPHVEAEPKETALAWLRRVGSKEALAAIRSWEALEEWGRSVGSCSHTLWDMLAGSKGTVEPMFRRVSIVLKPAEARRLGLKHGGTFYFPLLAEACLRQGTDPPVGAIRTKKLPKSHRMPQVKRWNSEKLRGAQ
jgi:hypothetical protein